MSISEIKNLSRTQLKENFGEIFLGVLLFGILSTAGSFAAIIIYGPLVVGFSTFLIMTVRKNNIDIKNLFTGFNEFGRNCVMYILESIYMFLWSLLLFIPGIIKSCAYSMSAFIAAEHSELSASEVITESRRMMDGHKMDYFLLQLSFLGWYILSCLTFGILLIWVIPYVQLANVNFYESIKPRKKFADETEE